MELRPIILASFVSSGMVCIYPLFDTDCNENHFHPRSVAGYFCKSVSGNFILAEDAEMDHTTSSVILYKHSQPEYLWYKIRFVKSDWCHQERWYSKWMCPDYIPARSGDHAIDQIRIWKRRGLVYVGLLVPTLLRLQSIDRSVQVPCRLHWRECTCVTILRLVQQWL